MGKIIELKNIGSFSNEELVKKMYLVTFCSECGEHKTIKHACKACGSTKRKTEYVSFAEYFELCNPYSADPYIQQMLEAKYRAAKRLQTQ